MVKQGADVSKAEDNTPGNGLAGVATAEEPIRVTHHPAYRWHVVIDPCQMWSHALIVHAASTPSCMYQLTMPVQTAV